MGNCLNEHPNVAVFGESCFWGRHYIEPTNSDGSYSRSDANVLCKRLKSGSRAFLGDGPGLLKHFTRSSWDEVMQSLCFENKTPAEAFMMICDAVSAREGKASIVEKTPHHVVWIPRIKSALPGAKFLIMVRDPYGFVLSYKHQGDRKSAQTKANFERLYHPVACAFIWRRYMKSALAMKRRYTTDTKIVEFASLRERPEELWFDVLDFFGFDSAGFCPVAAKNSSFQSNRAELTSVEKFWVNFICGKYSRLYGFRLEESGVGCIQVLSSAVAFVPWAFQALLTLKGKVSGGLFKYLSAKN